MENEKNPNGFPTHSKLFLPTFKIRQQNYFVSLMVKYEYEVQCVCISKSQTCGQPCTVMGMAAWCWGRDTLMGTAGVRVWTIGAGGSTDTTCCSPSTAGAQPELVINDILSCFLGGFLNHTDVIKNSLQIWIYEK